MFPIPWNFPFRKKDGSLGKIEDLGGSYTLPTASANVKGGIKVGSGATMDGEKMNIDPQLPAYGIGDAGKVLRVNAHGELEWATVSAGGNRFARVSTSNTALTASDNAEEVTI